MTSQNGTKPKVAETKADALQQYQNSDGHFSLVRNFRLADLITIMNGFCGVYSLFSSARYLLSNEQTDLYYALSFPLAGLMFDFFDGKVARWRKSASLLGQELDSLADLISFGVAPAVLAFVIGLRTPIDTFVLSGFVCCGLARLARFNATVALIPKNEAGKSKYFEGLPIPSTLGIVAVMAFFAKQGWIEGQQGLPLDVWRLWEGQRDVVGLPAKLGEGSGDVHQLTLLFAAWAAAMVSKTLHVPKL